MQRPLAECGVFRYNDSMKVNTTNEALLAAAREAVSAAYDGERHTVGAAVLCGSGAIYAGVNVWSLHGACAEQVALGCAAAHGETNFVKIAAVRGKHGEEILPPCGNCRQMLADYAPECEVLLPGGQTKKAKDLLPFAYHAEF